MTQQKALRNVATVIAGILAIIVLFPFYLKFVCSFLIPGKGTYNYCIKSAGQGFFR